MATWEREVAIYCTTVVDDIAWEEDDYYEMHKCQVAHPACITTGPGYLVTVPA
jgi:hypothetical protein